jgi:selenocysteine-specific elongation factor
MIATQIESVLGPTRHFILGTAGHIDHGKSSLVKALTGTDPDRLPEEKRRGMTIELGFAELTVGATRFGIVDVPGHERFVRTMVAGATGIDLALLVVAADDSVMPQTVEHVEILNLLGVRHAVVALTKIDAVDNEIAELAKEDVLALLAGTPLESSPICPVSSVTGTGLNELRETLLNVSGRIAVRPAQRPFRMAIDRVFTVQGRGTVVTGSVLRGVVEEGETLEILPSRRMCRVRGLQSHGAASPALTRGQRAALNLSGVDREVVERGFELATPGYLEPSPVIDVRIQCLRTMPQPLKSTVVARLGIGTREVPVRVVLYEDSFLEAGGSGWAQLRCGEPLTALFGQRFILRDSSSTRTIGGGEVLVPAARRRWKDTAVTVAALRQVASGSAEQRLEQVLRAAGFMTPTRLQLCARTGIELSDVPDQLERLKIHGRWGPVAGTQVFGVPQAVEDLFGRLRSWLERYHREHPELPGRNVDSVLGWLERIGLKEIARPLFDSFLGCGKLKLLGRFVSLPEFAPKLSTGDEKLLKAVMEELRAAGFQPPAVESLAAAAGVDRKRLDRLTTLAVALGDLVRIDPPLYLHVDSERKLRDIVRGLVAERGAVSVSEVREALGSSRKYVVPFLEYLDRVGFTIRIEDRRVLAEGAAAADAKGS